MSELLVNQCFIIQKKEGKGGWSYVAIPNIAARWKDNLGLVRVCGNIDTYAFKQFNLLPMKDGCMMLPIKAAARKKIAKQEGDTVHVILYYDDTPVVIPEDILVALLDVPAAHHFFLTLSGSNQKHYIDWVEDSKKLETKVERICKMIERLEKKLRFYDW